MVASSASEAAVTRPPSAQAAAEGFYQRHNTNAALRRGGAFACEVVMLAPSDRPEVC